MSTASHYERHETEAESLEGKLAESVDHDKRAMQIAAAQLRLVTDRRLGKKTPEWVKRLAAEKPRSRWS